MFQNVIRNISDIILIDIIPYHKTLGSRGAQVTKMLFSSI